MLLLFSLFSPIVELFPNLYMSWWLPDNGNIEAYLRAWPRRVIVVLVVWLPILFTLGTITSIPVQLVITALVLIAFSFRIYFFDRALHQSRINKADFIEPSKIPEILYFIAFSSIGWVLFSAVPNKQWLVPLAILLIFSGAFIMGSYRSGTKTNFSLDVFGRGLFVFGFLLNLYNLARAASIM